MHTLYAMLTDECADGFLLMVIIMIIDVCVPLVWVVGCIVILRAVYPFPL